MRKWNRNQWDTVIFDLCFIIFILLFQYCLVLNKVYCFVRRWDWSHWTEYVWWFSQLSWHKSFDNAITSLCTATAKRGFSIGVGEPVIKKEEVRAPDPSFGKIFKCQHTRTFAKCIFFFITLIYYLFSRTVLCLYGGDF